ncbi:MAG: DNA polymerase IV [Anaerolineae bacterium]|nr:DNA polymerase IV [Candidatus Roseilinea sp.]MDW8449291.1 DNA polymerase IV [Anaerolineae bacterium]
MLHLDLDAFFCAVEELRDPSLRGKPFIVGGRPDQRGVVSSASYPARRFGVRNAMPTSQAMRLCPGLIVVSGSRALYAEYSKRVMNLLRDYGGALQQISIDEAFLDATGLTQDPQALALEIQSRIHDEVGLPASIGVATSKLVAKMASGRAKPNGVLVVAPGDEAEFLAPMPAGELWGIGPATAARLEQIGIATIGDLQRASPQMLRSVFHDHAEAVIARAHGVDSSPVHAEREVKSISEERTFARDVRDPETLRRMLLALSDEVAARLRAHNRFARTVHLKLRWHDFYTVTRQTALPAPTQLGEEIFAAVEPLWRQAWLGRGGGRDRQRGDPVRLIGVGVSGLSEGLQMALFDDPRREARLALAHTLDELRAQYGSHIVRRAGLLRHHR